MGVCKKIKRRADQERNVWELFRMYKNEKKILGLSESTLQNYEDSLKRFMDYMECTITETIREVLDKRIGEIEKIAVIVSDEKRKDMDAALKEKFPGYNEEINDQVYTSLIQSQVLPEECEILISTSRLKEGVDILNENACVICDNIHLTEQGKKLLKK